MALLFKCSSQINAIPKLLPPNSVLAIPGTPQHILSNGVLLGEASSAI